MSDILPIDMQAEALDLLPSQYANSTALRAYLSALSVTFQQIDDVLQQMQFGLSVSDAQGVQLDQLGQRVGQLRRGGPYPVGESDALYRPKVYARSLANRSNGTTEELIAILGLLLAGKLQSVNIEDAYPAGFYVILYVSSALNADEKADVIDFMLAAKPASVRIHGIAPVQDPVFAFDGFPVPPGAGYDVGGWVDYFYP